MPSLSFQKQFVPLIRSGSKEQTIRADRKRPFRLGDLLALYYAQRTRHCELLMRRHCIGADHIAISRGREWGWELDAQHLRTHYLRPEIEINGVRLAKDEADAFVIMDGFTSMLPFASFWDLTRPFSGQRVRWHFTEAGHG